MLQKFSTHQRQSYHHDRKRFEMMELQRKPHIGIDPMKRDSHFPEQLECLLSCAAVWRVKTTVKVNTIKSFWFILNLHQPWLHFDRKPALEDDPGERSDKTHSHPYTTWPSIKLHRSYRNDTRVELCCFLWHDLVFGLQLIEEIP